MANWCFNTVEFIGEHSQFERLEQLFTEMKKKEEIEGKGQLPAFIESDEGYFFECGWESGILYYLTRWSPNIENLQMVADHYGVGFTLYYSETANLIYGEACYAEGSLTDVYLESKDFDQYEFDEDKDTYNFEGKDYESSEDVLEILLKRKKEALNLTCHTQNIA